MDLLPVISSNVSAIGYLQEECLLRIRFVDGSVYDYPGIPSEKHRELMLSDSKGKWIRANLKEKGIRNHTFTKEVADEKLEPLGAEPQGDTLSETIAPLHFLDFEAGFCCSKHLAKIVNSYKSANPPPPWQCPSCGLSFVGFVPHPGVMEWRIKVQTFVVRR